MTILDLVGRARTYLHFCQAGELPSFPHLLSEWWAHPDALFALFSPSGYRKSFLGTSFPDELLPSASRASFRPYLGLIWRPFSAELWDILPNLVNSTAMSGGESESSAHQVGLLGTRFQARPLGQQGASWKITLSDCPIGEVLLLSKVLGFPLEAPLWACKLDLVSLSEMTENLGIAEPPNWDETPWSALHAWAEQPVLPEKDPLALWKAIRLDLIEHRAAGVPWQNSFEKGMTAGFYLQQVRTLGDQWSSHATRCLEELSEYWRQWAKNEGIVPPEKQKNISAADFQKAKVAR